MGLTVTVTPGKQFAATEKITNPKLNQLGQPTFTVTGTVATSDITNNSVTSDKTIAGAHFYTASVSFSGGDYTLTLSGSPAVADGMVVAFKASANGVPHVTNGIRLVVGASTLELFKNKTERLVAGDIVANQIIEARYVSTGWQMTSQLAQLPDTYAATVGGTANAITLTITPPASYPLTLADLVGRRIRFKVALANSGAVTLATTIGGSALAAKNLYRNFNVPLRTGDLNVNQIVEVVYEATADAYQMVSQLGSQPTEYAATDTGTAGTSSTTLVVLPTAGYTAYNQITGKPLTIVPANTNVGSSTLTVSGVATPPAVQFAGRATLSGEVTANRLVNVVYDGTNAQLLTPPLPALGKAWCKVNASGTDKTITNALPGSDQQTVAGHGLTAATNLNSVQAGSVRTATTLPTGLSANTIYYLRVVDTNTLTFHTTAAGALANTSRVAITVAGGGVNTLHYNPISAAYNVDGVISRSSGSALTAGDLEVYWTQSFSSGNYVVVGSAIQTGSNAIGVSIHASDTGVGTLKRLFIEQTDGADTSPTELHLLAFGLQ